MIYLLLDELGVCQLGGQVAVVGEQQHAGGVAVQASHGIDALGAGVAHQVKHGGTAVGIVARGDAVLGFVQKYVAFALGRNYLVVVFHHVVALDLGAEFGHDLTVHLDLACGDVFVGLAARAQACVGHIFVQTDLRVRIDVLQHVVYLLGTRCELAFLESALVVSLESALTVLESALVALVTALTVLVAALVVALLEASLVVTLLVTSLVVALLIAVLAVALLEATLVVALLIAVLAVALLIVARVVTLLVTTLVVALLIAVLTVVLLVVALVVTLLVTALVVALLIAVLLTVLITALLVAALLRTLLIAVRTLLIGAGRTFACLAFGCACSTVSVV